MEIFWKMGSSHIAEARHTTYISLRSVDSLLHSLPFSQCPEILRFAVGSTTVVFTSTVQMTTQQIHSNDQAVTVPFWQ